MTWPRRLAFAAAAVCVAGTAAVWLVALVPLWPCVLLEHFRVQYAAIAIAVVSATAALRMRVYFDVAAIALLLHVLWIAPDLSREPRRADGTAVRVLVLNVHTESSSFDEVRALIADLQPDVIGLVEVDDRWLAGIAAAVADYRGRLELPRRDNFGVALYTREPLRGSIETLGGSLPVAVADVTVRAARFGAILVHPLPPVSAAALTAQRDELDAVADRARAMAAPIVIMGDFNATPWSRPFRSLVARTGLCDSRAGFGVQASFPADSFVFRIPIDHLLASCSIGVRERRIERDVGSDHLPVYVELTIPRD
jgi:endonuclease/exonuclease/phosphatase (EEP) superfamily protein YafD